MFSSLAQMKNQLTGLSPRQRRDLGFLSATMFFTLAAYPMVRSVATALFINASGAKNSPFVWLYSVLALAGAVAVYNRLQTRLSVHRLFVATALASSSLLLALAWPAGSGHTFAAYALYIVKEVYIVLLVHLALSYFNASSSKSLARIVYGPLGACGSIGGVLGGLATGFLAAHISPEWLVVPAAGLTLLASVCFWFTARSAHAEKTAQAEPQDGLKCEQSNQQNYDKSKITGHNLGQIGGKRDRATEACLEHAAGSDGEADSQDGLKCEQLSPLQSIRGISHKVALIAALVGISQFVIALVDFQFNLALESALPDKGDQTQFLGNFYSSINTLALLVQFFVLPFLLNAFSTRSIHHSIPAFYATAFIISALSGAGFLAVATVLATFKGLDYSLFAAAKELLYFNFNERQKYGAKYVVDMVAYRFAKGAISLLLIFFQSALFIKVAALSLLALWGICAALFFKGGERATTAMARNG